jgi:FkbM family methyltransferase
MRYAIRKIGNRLGYDVIKSGKFAVDIVPLKSKSIGRSPIADINRFLKSAAPVIFDVGANVGQSVRRYKDVFPESTIYSFEPGPATFKSLQSNVSKYANVTPWNYGLGATRGKLTLQENSLTEFSSFLPQGDPKFSYGNVVRTTEVDVETIDSFCDAHAVDTIDLLKSDTQGFELEVFRGGEQMMKAGRIGLVHCEIIFSRMYERLPTYVDICAQLDSCGFRLVTFYPFYYQDQLAGWSDALFVHDSYHARSGVTR